MSQVSPTFPALMHLPELLYIFGHLKKGYKLSGSSLSEAFEGEVFPSEAEKNCNFQTQFAQFGAYLLPTFY